MKTIHFVGAGSGAADLITLRGKQYLEEADTIIYAGSLVNPQLLDYAKAGCSIYNSAQMTLEEVLEVMRQDVKAEKQVVRLHTGAQSGSRWMCWMKRASLMITARASALSAGLPRR